MPPSVPRCACCGVFVSPKACFCPRCGARVPPQSPGESLLAFLVSIVLWFTALVLGGMGTCFLLVGAGSIADAASIRITGDPSSPDFVKQEATAAAGALVQVRAGAQAIVTTDVVQFTQPLQQDNVAIVDVPVLIQGDQYFTVQGTTHVRVENVAAPAILPDSLMVSDFPERLTENGILFASDLQRGLPSRFLYFHFNPAGEPARRVVLRAEN